MPATLRAQSLICALTLVAGCSTLDFGKFSASGDAAGDAVVDSSVMDTSDGDDATIDDGSVDAGTPELCNGDDDDGDRLVDETTLDDGLCGDALLACRDGTCVDAPAEVAAGTFHTCVRMTSGQVYCFGENGERQSGGTTPFVADPALVATDAGPLLATTVSAGTFHTCAIQRDTQRPHCWGSDLNGRLAAATAVPASTAIAVPAYLAPLGTFMGFTASSAATGEAFTVFGEGSTLVVAGVNDAGQLVNGTAGDADMGAVRLSDVLDADAMALTAGQNHACALLVDGNVYCWGANSAGQAGPLPSGDMPREVGGPFESVSAGSNHTCAVGSDRIVRCWGLNVSLQSGHDGVGGGTPTAVAGLTDARLVGAGFAHTCAVDGAGSVLCWGSNESAQLGDLEPSRGPTAMPIRVDLGLVDERVIDIGVGGAHTCVITSRRRVICWGANMANQSSPDSSGSPILPAPHPFF